LTAGVLLLAAGQGRRFGSDKRRASLPAGSSLLQSTIASVIASGLPLRVCLGPADVELQGTLEMRGVDCILCARAGEGMGATLAEAVAALPEDWDGVLVALADMPWIDPDSYCQVAASLCEDRIVVPRYRGQRGHPVAFPMDYVPQLAALEGDEGARRLLQAHQARIAWIDLDDPGIVRDVDTPGDLSGPGDQGATPRS